jgi:hypothetical protein
MSVQIEFLERLEGDLRAAAARPRRHRGGVAAPRVLIAAAAVLLTSGSLALAFGDRMLSVLDDGPAPTHVKSEFRLMTKPPVPLDGAPPFPKGYLPGAIVPGSERQVASARTSRGTTARLYAARTARGKLCTILVGWPFAGGGCWGGTPPVGGIEGFVSASMARRPSPHSPAVRTISGHVVSTRATALRVVYGDGTHHDVGLVDGWFMFEVPSTHSSRALAPVRLEVLTATGARVGTVRDPLHLHPPKVHFTFPVPSSVRLLASTTLPNGGGTLAIWSGHDAAGHNCFRHLRNGKSQRFPAWDCTAPVGNYGYPLHPVNNVLAHVAVSWELAGANDPKRPVGFGYAYATGWVAPSVVRLTVRFQDGGSSEVTLHDRYYLYVVPPAHWPDGHRPSILEARDASGALVYRAFLYPRQHCVYPGRDPACRNRGLGSG